MFFDIKFSQKDREHSSRAKEVISDFDLKLEHADEHFSGDIEIDGCEWSIGAIIGGSGTGKSTIAKKLFPNDYIGGGMTMFSIACLMICQSKELLKRLSLLSLP